MCVWEKDRERICVKSDFDKYYVIFEVSREEFNIWNHSVNKCSDQNSNYLPCLIFFFSLFFVFDTNSHTDTLIDTHTHVCFCYILKHTLLVFLSIFQIFLCSISKTDKKYCLLLNAIVSCQNISIYVSFFCFFFCNFYWISKIGNWKKIS